MPLGLTKNASDTYARSSRSFSKVRSDDLDAVINHQYHAGRIWPDVLLTLNPRYLQGPSVCDLVATGDLDEATRQIFSVWNNAHTVSSPSGPVHMCERLITLI
jgi:hypothetical protein